MKKYDNLWNQCNNLLSSLRASRVINLVQKYYAPYHNDAPAYLMDKYINELQKSLDEAQD